MNASNRSNNASLLPLVLIGGVLLIVGGFLISLLTPSLFPDQASAEAEQIDTLFTVLMGIGGAIFLLVEGLLIYSIVRFRTKPGDTEDGPTIHGNVMLEIIWTAIPAVIVLILVIYSYGVWVDIREPKENEYTVEVVAQRFAWTFYYADPLERVDPRDTPPAPNVILTSFEEVPEAGEEPETDEAPVEAEAQTLTGTSSDLHVYIGQNVNLNMGAMDVIHSFWVPEFRVKQDLLPGRYTELRFSVISPFDDEMIAEMTEEDWPIEYRVVCTELCGSGHGQMGLDSQVLIYQDEEAWEEALESMIFDPILNPPTDPVEAGGTILASGNYPCSGCHVLVDQSEEGSWAIDWAGITGPALQQVGSTAANARFGAGGTSSPEAYLYQSIFNSNAYIVDGYSANIMPVFSATAGEGTLMSTTDVYNIVGYLCSLGYDSLEDSDCDMENLAELINTDYPDSPVQIGNDDEAETGIEATAEVEMTAEAETTPEAEMTPEATAEAEATEDASDE